MIIRLVKRSRPNIKVKIKPYAPQTSPKEYELSLLAIYQQAKEDYNNGKANLI
jgi:hypothetical protein